MRINKLQTCDTQVLRLYDKLEEGLVDITTLPASLPLEMAGWYSTTFINITTDKAIVYQDFTDTIYNYIIRIHYESTGITCNSNPVLDCNCIMIYKEDKFGNSASDNVLPESVLNAAIDTLPIIEECDDDENELYTKLNGKKVDTSKIPYVADISTVTVDGWYKTTIAGRDVVIYVEKSDLNNDYEIEIDEIENEISTCNEIETEVSDKSGNPVVGVTIPPEVKARAISALPITTCGTGLWNGCTAGIQNKYLIAGTVAAAGLYFLNSRK